MTDAYQNALKLKAKLEGELNEVSAFLDMYARFAGTNAVHETPSASMGSGDKSPVRDWAKPNEIVDAAEEAIRAKGKPLTRSEIVAALEARGMNFNSEDKSRYVGTILWRQKDRFLNLAGRGYVLPDMASLEDRLENVAESAEGDDE